MLNITAWYLLHMNIEHKFLIYYQQFEPQVLTNATKHLNVSKHVSEF